MPDVPGTINYPATLDSAVTLIQAANNAQTTLSSAATSGDTTLTVVSTSAFPSTGAVSIEAEVIFYTGKTGTTFTGCVRGRDGTTAAAHASGTAAQGLIVAAHHNTLASGLIAAETKLGSGASTPASGTVLQGTGAGTSAWSALSNATTSTAGLMSAADKTKLDNAASAATASTLMLRDASGRAKVATPSATDDIATKGYVDSTGGTVTAVTGNGGITSSGGTAPNISITDGGVTDAKIGNRTVDDTLASPANTGTVTQLFSWVGGRLKAITGKTDWKTAPATTLEAAATHIASTSNPHSTTAAQVGAIPTTEKGAASGVATLDSGSKLLTSQLPALSITETFVVASQVAMLALTAQQGDVAVRTDLSKSFILAGTNPSVLANWTELLSPAGAVVSVNSQTGAVSLNAANVGALAITNNLSDLASAATARTNLGLGTAAPLDVASSGNATATQVVKGNDTRLTDSRTPTGTAGGSLSGTYPNPTLAANAATDAVIGNRTADDTLTSPANTGTVTQLFSWLAGRLKAITGKSDWKTAPAITLEALSAHKDRHKSGGADAFTSSDIVEAVVKRLQETSGPTTLAMGSVPDGQYLKRSGSTLIGDAAAGGPVIAYKTTDESVTNSVTVQDDNTLLFALGANETWTFRIVGFTTCAANGAGFKYSFNGPAGFANLRCVFTGYDIDAQSIRSATIVTAYNVLSDYAYSSGSAPDTYFEVEGTVENGATAGNFVFRWAQRAANANPTIVKRGSYLMASKV